jgi:hypothetical protein
MDSMAVAIYLLCFLLWAAMFGALGWYVAIQCGRSEIEGLVLGVLFGPLGALVVGLLPKGQRTQQQQRKPDTPVHDYLKHLEKH